MRKRVALTHAHSDATLRIGGLTAIADLKRAAQRQLEDRAAGPFRVVHRGTNDYLDATP